MYDSELLFKNVSEFTNLPWNVNFTMQLLPSLHLFEAPTNFILFLARDNGFYQKISRSILNLFRIHIHSIQVFRSFNHFAMDLTKSFKLFKDLCVFFLLWNVASQRCPNLFEVFRLDGYLISCEVNTLESNQIDEVYKSVWSTKDQRWFDFAWFWTKL